MRRSHAFAVALAVTSILILFSTTNGFVTSTFVKSTSNPVFIPAVSGFDKNGVAMPSVMLDGALYRMWYMGLSGSNQETIGYVASSDGINWVGRTQVLVGGQAWEGSPKQIDHPTVIKDTAGCVVLVGTCVFKMWYSDELNTGIGYAESPDGLAWTEYATNPVLTATQIWESGKVGYPYVMKSTGTYKAWYYTGGGIGYATSSDGVTWTQYPAPVLTTSSGWDRDVVYSPSVLVMSGTYEMWYSGETVGPPFAVFIGEATSTNAVTWTKNPANPVLVGSSNSWEDATSATCGSVGWDIDHPYLLQIGTILRMYYTAFGLFSGTCISRIGYADAQPPTTNTVTATSTLSTATSSITSTTTASTTQSLSTTVTSTLSTATSTTLSTSTVTTSQLSTSTETSVTTSTSTTTTSGNFLNEPSFWAMFLLTVTFGVLALVLGALYASSKRAAAYPQSYPPY